MLIPFESTYALYHQGDHMGELCALLAQTPVFAVVALATNIVTRRDLGSMALFTGLLVATLTCSTLKKVFKEPRPSGPDYPGYLPGDEYGLPSNHATFTSFLAVYTALWSLTGRWRSPYSLLRFALAIGALGFAVSVAASRVYLHYHTVKQVSYGGVVGGSMGLVWFAAVETLLRGRLAGWLVALPLAKWLRVRDLSDVDTLEVEYAAVTGGGSVGGGKMGGVGGGGGSSPKAASIRPSSSSSSPKARASSPGKKRL